MDQVIFDSRGTEMKKVAIVIALLCLALPAFADENTYYFSDLFEGYETIDEARATVISGGTVEERIKAGVAFFTIGSNRPKKDSDKEPILRECLAVFDTLWREDRGNDRITMLLAYAHAGVGGNVRDLDEIMTHVFRARTLFDIVVARRPQNIDPRLGRTMVNMHLPKGNGRPDDIILEDTAIFLEIFATLDPDTQNHPFYQMGLMEMRLARALILTDRRKKREARAILATIDRSVLPDEAFTRIYDTLSRKLGR